MGTRTMTCAPTTIINRRHTNRYNHECSISFIPQAGIDSRRLQFSLEPEAASIWCRTEKSDSKAAIFGFETKYVVVDLGGNNVFKLLYGI